jgi:hypothetical protein
MNKDYRHLVSTSTPTILTLSFPSGLTDLHWFADSPPSKHLAFIPDPTSHGSPIAGEMVLDVLQNTIAPYLETLFLPPHLDSENPLHTQIAAVQDAVLVANPNVEIKGLDNDEPYFGEVVNAFWEEGKRLRRAAEVSVSVSRDV